MPAERARAARRRDRAHRPGDRDLRALALPVGRDAAPVPAPRRADRCSPPTATAARRSAATSTASRCAASCRRADDGVLECDPHGVRDRRRAAAARRLLPVRARRAAPLPPPRARDARARAERRRRRPGLERGGGDRAHDRHAARRSTTRRSGCASTSSTTPAPTRRPTSCWPRPTEHPGRVFHLRRAKGGEGKAHTLNHGLRQIRAEGWYEAVLIIDADVIFTARSLRRMVRHLARPRGRRGHRRTSRRAAGPANYMNRFVAFEYISAQAGARRAQNVLGAQACLAGGAQLLRRESLEAIGGEIDTSSLAEDTFTTFNVQLAGGRVVFEPHAIVWAEEPRDIAGLWKQRLRWGRGNVQVTLRYRALLAAPQRRPARRRQLRADLVLGLPDAGADGALLGLAGHAVRARPRPGDRRLPLAVGAEPRHLPVRDALGVRAGRRRRRAAAGARRSRSPG